MLNSTKKTVAFEERYKLLNKEQKRAVDTTEGPVLVVAGPGTGKTELISLRVGKILKNGTANANNILCLTFTETAATNMRDRLEVLIGPDAFRVAIYTFHGFCTDVMGRYQEYFYNAAHMRPASDLLQSEILERIFSSLPHKHPLGGYHPELGFSYLKEAQAKIKDIKKGGLTPTRFKEVIEKNKDVYKKINPLLQEYLPERVGKDARELFVALAQALERDGSDIASLFAKSIYTTIKDADSTETTAPFSAWKTKYVTKDEDNIRVFKESLAIEKLLALGDVYEAYQNELYRSGHFDYEDMIIEVVEALEKHPTLRADLEEQYQYIMVDEFQDTNNAQLSLVMGLSSNPVHEGRANVCVVGDDDQAVYKFQGAEISNIHSFRTLYKDVEIIVLTENYRSTQQVLDFARSVVLQGVNRLENTTKEVRKDLQSKNKKLTSGILSVQQFPTQEQEYAFVAERIKGVIEKGEKPSEIAVIAREHKQLRALLPYLDALHVPYTYTREENVFDEQHVRELLVITRYLASVVDGQSKEELLPEILSFPFWGIERVTIWEIAEHAKRNNVSWLSAMKDHGDKNVKQLALFLIELGVLSKTTPLEIILDILIGSKDMPQVSDDEHDDTYEHTPVALSVDFISPYKTFYFGEIVYTQNPSKYISFLSSLRVFIRALREYKDGNMLKVTDVGPFVDMHVDYNIALINNTPFAHDDDAVSLHTSHSAKGLEFGTVFIISANDAIWAGKKKGGKLTFPINVPLSQTPDDEDDFIRLFYVALTRARHTLHVTHHESPFRFLLHEGVSVKGIQEETMTPSDLLAVGLKVYHVPPFANNEKALLKKVLDGYKLSPTHLNNFLNIVDGGPMKFLEQNLLRFPQAKTKSSIFGTAVHKALEDLYREVQHTGKVPTCEVLINSFEKELRRGRLLEHEEKQQYERGVEVITRYYEAYKDSVEKNALVELDFSKQGVVIDGVHVTGKIDRSVEVNKNEWVVVDIKTGKGLSHWDAGKSEHEKIKLHNYRHQLMMYKLLVEHSRDYEHKKVMEGRLMFVEENAGEDVLSLSFDTPTTKKELEDFKRLIAIVYEKIMNLDFPDTSQYPQTFEGVLLFEQDLLQGKI